MLDDELDHMIREAAENHHPPYNDKAWDKMQQKLDKHLPQKKDNRRLIFFLLFFLLLGGGLLFFINNRTANSNVLTAEKGDKNTSTGKTDDPLMKGPAQASQVSEKKLPPSLSTSEDISASVNTNTVQDKTTEINSVPSLSNKQQTSGYKTATHIPTVSNADITDEKQKASKGNVVNVFNENENKQYELNQQNRSTGSNRYKIKTRNVFAKALGETQAGDALANTKKPTSGKTGSTLKVTVTAPGTEDEDPALVSASDTVMEKKDAEPPPTSKINSETSKEPIKSETDKKLIASTKTGKKKSQNKFSNNFGLTFSMGPDMSFVKLKRTGKTTITYGAGLSYDFAKRLTARAGFYVSRKKYQASPEEYHNTIYPNLTSIDANCKVYEIPFAITYNFAKRNKHNWFGNVGISSFIMKKEDYVYNYKTPAGQTYTYDRSISNENKHLFSVLNLSAGYKYQLSQKISLQAEPYVQIPLGGVGFGKIKLNSAGVLFTATYKPFKKKK